MLSHRLHVRGGQIKLCGDLKVREVQPHRVQAQHPHSQRLVMTGQYRIRKIIKPSMTGLAEIALPMELGLVTAIADNRLAIATGTAHSLRPAMLAHQIKAFGIIQQRREVDQLGYRHADTLLAQTEISAGHQTRCFRSPPSLQRSPPRNPTRALTFW